MNGAMTYDPMLKAYVPAIPCPFYVWQFWKWQKVRCHCGKEIITRDLGLLPNKYATHYVLNHISPLE
jgi:hypothetical protein